MLNRAWDVVTVQQASQHSVDYDSYQPYLDKLGLTYLFISHDLGVVRHLCQRVVVMQKGRIVEEGPVDRVFFHPQQEYTQRLIASRPTRKKLKGGLSHD